MTTKTTQITKDQALALVSALFSTQCVGVDSEGNEYGPERNAHFLDALRVLFPDLPGLYVLTRFIDIPKSAAPEDYRHKYISDQNEQRKRFADILRGVADAIERTEEK